MSNTCWRPRVTGNTESGFTERNQTAGRTPPTEKAGTGKPERARPPFDERCRACPHRPAPPHPSFCTAAQAHKRLAFPLFPAEQDGGRHVGGDSRSRWSRAHRRSRPSPSLPAFLPFARSTPVARLGGFAFEPGPRPPRRSSSLRVSGRYSSYSRPPPPAGRAVGEGRPLRRPNAAYLEKMKSHKAGDTASSTGPGEQRGCRAGRRLIKRA